MFQSTRLLFSFIIISCPSFFCYSIIFICGKQLYDRLCLSVITSVCPYLHLSVHSSVCPICPVCLARSVCMTRHIRKFSLPDFQNLHFSLNHRYMIQKKRWPNPFGQLTVLLAPGHRAVGYVEPLCASCRRQSDDPIHSLVIHWT